MSTSPDTFSPSEAPVAAVWPPQIPGIDYYYHDDATAIVCGDCLDVLPKMAAGSVDLVLTDPPYGTTKNAWDSTKSWNWNAIKAASRGQVVFSSQPFTAFLVTGNLNSFKHEVIWVKSHATGHLNVAKKPMLQHENICVFGDVQYTPIATPKPSSNIRPLRNGSASGCYNGFGKNPGSIIKHGESAPRSVVYFDSPNHGEKGLHPTQKPVRLIRCLLQLYLPSSSTVLDPFMGSGTTLVAAKQLGRRAIGIEIEPKYCDIAVQRLAQEVLAL